MTDWDKLDEIEKDINQSFININSIDIRPNNFVVNNGVGDVLIVKPNGDLEFPLGADEAAKEFAKLFKGYYHK